ncbi:MAG: tripartite tricarboxylate transporter substrate binding protein [Xanthobacteraceae bacterium]|nr:tripartite tricarboxylate transporter substrate binding protein [Xanthobacteraceae bacterium]
MHPVRGYTTVRTAACGLLIVAMGAFSVSAEDYPTRPITLVVSFAPGGLSDIPARLLSADMQQRIGQSIVVENRPGASGITGGSSVHRASPDGYTLLVSAISEVQNLYYLSVPYKFTSDFTQIGKIADGPTLVLIVNSASPYETLADLIQDAKAHFEKISFATSGPATSPAIAVSQLNSMAGMKIVDVPYRGTALAATAVMSGDVQGAFVFYPSAKPLVDDGKVRVLAVADTRRMPQWKDVPTMAELGFPGFEHNAFVGLSGPPNMAPAIVAKLSKALNETVQSPLFRERIEPLGMVPPSGENTPETFTKFLVRETEHQAELAKLSGRELVK